MLMFKPFAENEAALGSLYAGKAVPFDRHLFSYSVGELDAFFDGGSGKSAIIAQFCI